MATLPFEIWDVSEWEVVADETAGQDEKRWLIQPDGHTRWLFKPPTTKNGFRQGEDWSERVSGELAALIAVPCAEVQLAVRGGQPGSISKNLRPKDWEMQSGSLLLAEADPSYRPGSMNVKGRPGHSLATIAESLRDADVPPGSRVPASFTGFDVFAGFMVLDAWIANRDRHDENWSILIPPATETPQRRLCGSYDQAGSLGFNVPAQACADRLSRSDGVISWASRGTAHRFEYDPKSGPQTLVEHAVDALSLTSTDVREYWIERVMDVSPHAVADLLAQVPNLSDHCRNFASEVVRINRRRLHDAYGLRFR